jgi:phospholipase C
MDRFDLINGGNVNGDYLSYSQYYESDIPNYFAYARNFVLADAFFSSLEGPSFPNHLYTVGAQSGRAINNPNTARWGCDAAATSRVQTLEESGEFGSVYPCFDFDTLADRLEEEGLSWKYYAPGQDKSGYIWSALNAIRPHSPDIAMAGTCGGYHAVRSGRVERQLAGGELAGCRQRIE